MQTVQEILSAAICASVDAFRAGLIEQAEISDDDARRTNNLRAMQGAQARRNAALAAYDDVKFGAVNDICEDVGKLVVALGVACKMLGVSSAKRNAALVTWQEARNAC